MAIAATHLVSAGSTTNANSYTTASITPGASRLVLAAVVNSAAGTPATPTLAGNSLTWVQIATVTYDTIATPNHRLTLFRALGSSPTTGTVVITASTSTGCVWSISDFSGTDTTGSDGSGAIIQSATNRTDTATSLTVTLAAFADAVNNAAYGAFGNNGAVAIDFGSGFTELGDAGYTSPDTRLETEWLLGQDTSVDASETFPLSWAGIAVEIGAPAAATGQPTMRRWGGVPGMGSGPPLGRSWG